MGRLFVVSLEGGSIYSCKHCKTHLALSHHIISKTFHCRHGKAYLFDKVVNVTVGEEEERMMITGMHTVVDIFCVGCGSIVGWKYESAHEKIQKYKEGKFILERCTSWHYNLNWFYIFLTNDKKVVVGHPKLTRSASIPTEKFKVLGPDGSMYVLGQEVQVGGSDADDA